MKPVYQDKFGHDYGNCYQACIASILEISLDEAPEVMQPRNDGYADNEWLFRLNGWLAPRGYMAILLPSGEDESNNYYFGPILTIASGLSPRVFGDKPTLHAVIWQNGKCIHDPHPDGTGLDGKPKDFTVFVPFNPAISYKAAVLGTGQ